MRTLAVRSGHRRGPCASMSSMRIALISDIHGNTVALDAVLADMGTPDVVVCLGDIAAGGPDPGGAIDRIAELGAISVQGNTDAGMVDMPEWWTRPSLMDLPEAAAPGMEVCVWGTEQLTQAQIGYLDALPITAEIDLGAAGDLLAFHGSPRSYEDFIAAWTPDDELQPMLAGSTHTVLAGGHTHVPLVRRHGAQTIVNPGSVGMPFAEYGFAGGVAVANHAAYGVVAVEGGELNLQLRRVAVDAAALADSISRSKMPRGDWWLELRGRPPS